MANVELRLNPRKPGNYAFFCPVTKLHLTLTSPVGMTDRVSPYILRGVKSKTLIDVNNVIDLETGKLNGDKKANKVEMPKETKVETPVKQEATVTPEQKEESSQEAEVAVDETVESNPSEERRINNNKRGKRTQANVADETATE